MSMLSLFSSNNFSVPGYYKSKVGDIQAPRGSKTKMILAALQRLSSESTMVQLEQACGR